MRDEIEIPPSFQPSSLILHPLLVDLARFERATSTFAGSRSNSPELQVLQFADCGLRTDGPGQVISTFRILKSAISNRLAEAAGVEPARALRDGLANRCHTVRRRLLTRISDCGLASRDNPHSEIRSPQSIGGRLGSRTLHGLSRRSFQDCLTHSTVGPSLNFWQGRSDLNRESRFWRPMVLPVSLHP